MQKKIIEKLRRKDGIITPRQKQVLEYLAQYIEANGIAPTMAEIGKRFELHSPASVHYILKGLEEAGAITRMPNVSRGIEIVKPPLDGRTVKNALEKAIAEQRGLLERLIELRAEMR